MTDALAPRRRSADSTGMRFLENLAYLVPGYRGYKDKELRREEDARLRGRVLAKLETITRALEERMARLAEGGLTETLEELDRRLRRCQGVAQAVRYAPYGFSGFFDAEKVREETLEQVLECDLILFQELDETIELLRGTGPLIKGRSSLASFVEALDDQIARVETRLVARDKVLGDR